jgi:hypothetical protein
MSRPDLRAIVSTRPEVSLKLLQAVGRTPATAGRNHRGIVFHYRAASSDIALVAGGDST